MDRSLQTPPATAVERLFEAVREGDPEGILKLLHPKAEWAPTAWSGERMYRGQEAVHLWLSQFGEELRHLDVQVRDRATREERGAVRGIVFDTRGSRTFAVEVSWSFELEEGLLRRGRAHDSWGEALEAAGLAGELARPSPAAPEPRAGRRTLKRVRQALRPNPECPVGRHFCRFTRS